MVEKIQSVMEHGGSGTLVDVECHLSNSLPNIVIVGIANKAVDEAKERIRGSFSACNIKLPKKRITLNLAPADIPKEGSSFDLPMILSILRSAEMISISLPKNTIVVGEVGLDGSIRPVRGVIGKILAARKHGIDSFVIPKGNLDQAQLIPGVKLYAFSHLKEVYESLNTDGRLIESKHARSSTPKILDDSRDGFEDIVGQDIAKRALVVAASGNHNIMLDGPPGTGKSMLAKALPSILPEMTQEEMLEVTHIHSLTRKNFDQIVDKRPVRTPHHSSSHISIIGGGQNPRPGEISLAHNGILFFDEFPEFSRNSIESLRQPLEDRQITVARAKDSIDFPADFILVATSNPCPCGHYGSKVECTCLPAQIQRYQKRISGPVVDRIDLYVSVDEVPHNKLLRSSDEAKRKETTNMAHKVVKARERQISRQGKLNSSLNNKEINRYIKLSEDALKMVNEAAKQMNLSGRGYMRTLKVARTIADIEGKDTVKTNHISEALQYRRKELYL